MTEPMDDDHVLALLADALGDDRPPADAVDNAYAAYGWRHLDDELAQLIDDSQVEVVLFRDSAYSRALSYRSEHGAIDVSIADDAFEVVTSPPAESIVMRHPSTVSPLEVSTEGKAQAEGITGPLRLEVSWGAGSSAVTSWITL